MKDIVNFREIFHGASQSCEKYDKYFQGLGTQHALKNTTRQKSVAIHLILHLISKIIFNILHIYQYFPEIYEIFHKKSQDSIFHEKLRP